MRRWLGAGLALVALAAAVIVFAALTPPDVELSLVLAEVSGTVHLSGPEQEASPARPGAELLPQQRVATGPEARAVLALGQETRIRLGPSSSVQVTGVDPEGVRLELEDGALHATVRPQSGAVRVGHHEAEIVATDAEFDVAARDGSLLFEVDRGEAALVGVEGVGALREGERAVVAGERPYVLPIPDSLLLVVRWPATPVTRDQELLVEGSTEPGSRVSVRAGGEAVEGLADAGGGFALRLPLAEGHNALRVESTNLLGERVAAESEIERDTRAPGFGGTIEYQR